MKQLNFHIYFLLILFANAVTTIQGRPDGDNDETNESFNGKIKDLYDEEKMCQIYVDSGWSESTAIVNQPYKLPTCLKNFQLDAYVPVCGKPMYSKFQYCAKALLTRNKDYANFNFEELFNKNKEILVLLDGCLDCMSWPERAANRSIKLLSPFEPKEVNTMSDAYGDFKIGALYKIDKEGQWQIQPKLEIAHQCNQYGMLQKKTILLPVLQPNLMNEMIYEKRNAHIQLIQQGLMEKTEELAPSKNRTKPLNPPKVDANAKKP